MKSKIRKAAVLLLLAVIVSACNNPRTSIISLFTSEKVIDHHTVIELADDEFLGFVFSMSLANNSLIVRERDRSEFYSIIDIRDNTVRRFGTRGQGPNELIFPTCFSILNDSIATFSDVSLSALFEVNYTGDLLPRRILEFNRDYQIRSIIPVSATRYIALGNFEEGRYLLMDETGRKLSFHFNFPTPRAGTNLATPMLQFLAFQGSLIRRPSGYAFFFAGRTSEILEIIEVDKDDNLKKIFSFHGEMAHLVTSGDGRTSGSVGIRQNSKKRFVSASATDNYIYLLYSGKEIRDYLCNAVRSNRLLVLDWQGNPVTKLLLDIEVNQIAVSENDEYLFAYANDLGKLVRFELR